MRFVVDRHLGRLAKWLRTMGYDTFYAVDCRTEELLRESAVPETAFVTTAGGRVPTDAVPLVFLVPKEDTALQLRALVDQARLDTRGGLFSRCVICNAPVEPVAKGACTGRVPDKVFERYDRFTRCPVCGRIYWEGTHTGRLRAALRSMLGEGGDEP
jgi:uncharacterized protein with PIN domain